MSKMLIDDGGKFEERGATSSPIPVAPMAVQRRNAPLTRALVRGAETSALSLWSARFRLRRRGKRLCRS